MSQISFDELLYSKYQITKPIRLIELFAGVGSQAMALRNLGVEFEHYKMVEFDKYPVASYNAIHNTNFEPSDITKVSGEDLNIVDTNIYEYIMTYSFPCQDLSIAGLQRGMTKGTSTRSGLLWEVERLLNESEELPQVLLMENVPQVIADANIEDFKKWQQFLESKGYKNFTEVLNAKNYGIPQNRERCFMVSILDKNAYYKFPEPIKLQNAVKDLLEDNIKIEYYLKENELLNLREYGCSYGFGGSIIKTGISNTITASYGKNSGNASMIKDNNGVRIFTEKECWRLMGFTDADFSKAEEVNSNSQLCKQAGNSIVVNVLEVIFKEMIRCDDE